MLWSQALVVAVLMEEMIKEEQALQRHSQTINKADIWQLQVKENVIMARILFSRFLKNSILIQKANFVKH